MGHTVLNVRMRLITVTIVVAAASMFDLLSCVLKFLHWDVKEFTSLRPD
jgi:hypothetical protein